MKTIDLSGDYNITLTTEGFENYFSSISFYRDYYGKATTARFPNTTDSLQLGEKSSGFDMGRLTREYKFTGNVFIEREIDIPEEFNGKIMRLFFERVHWISRVFIDGMPVGSRNSLVAPHVYEVGCCGPRVLGSVPFLKPGKHKLVICINNEYAIDIGKWCCAITDESATNWNGILGRMELQCLEDVFLEDNQLYFDGAVLKVNSYIYSRTDLEQARIHIRVKNTGIEKEWVTGLVAGYNKIGIDIPITEDVKRWDALNPNLYDIEIHLDTSEIKDSATITYGFRTLSKSTRNFLLNGSPVFFRGVVEDGAYAGFSHLPVSLEEWMFILGKYKEYGFNHVRFHSWCPPENAFKAADCIGIYFQVECPMWEPYGEISSNSVRTEFITEEALRIIRNYGNHASFVCMSAGNELGLGDDPYLDQLIKMLQSTDNRHFYTRTSHPCVENSCDDFFETAYLGPGENNQIVMIRGSGVKYEDNTHDYDKIIEPLDRPVISHEVGQFCGFVNFGNEVNFTHNLKPYFYLRYKDQMIKNGTFGDWEKFFRATAIWQRENYKCEIEAALRSKNLAGFSLLGLKDSPGWGNASIGLLDATLKDKGFADKDYHGMYCNDTVLLCQLDKFIYKKGEILKAVIQIYNYSNEKLEGDLEIHLKLADSGETVYNSGISSICAKVGMLNDIGEVVIPLDAVPNGCHKLELSLKAGVYRNKWDIWVLEDIQCEICNDVFVISDIREAVSCLEQGKKVLFAGNIGINRNIEYSDYSQVLWSYMLFKEQIHSYGLCIDKKHPALMGFGAEEYTEMLWYYLMKDSRLFRLKELNNRIKPIVQGVHVYDLGENIGYLFELMVGSGKLLVCGFNLIPNLDKRIEARYLYNSLLAYMQSEHFTPEVCVESSKLIVYFDKDQTEGNKGVNSIYYKGF